MRGESGQHQQPSTPAAAGGVGVRLRTSLGDGAVESATTQRGPVRPPSLHPDAAAPGRAPGHRAPGPRLRCPQARVEGERGEGKRNRAQSKGAATSSSSSLTIPEKRLADNLSEDSSGATKGQRPAPPHSRQPRTTPVSAPTTSSTKPGPPRRPLGRRIVARVSICCLACRFRFSPPPWRVRPRRPGARGARRDLPRVVLRP